jgi:hypothetical protein
MAEELEDKIGRIERELTLTKSVLKSIPAKFFENIDDYEKINWYDLTGRRKEADALMRYKMSESIKSDNTSNTTKILEFIPVYYHDKMALLEFKTHNEPRIELWTAYSVYEPKIKEVIFNVFDKYITKKEYSNALKIIDTRSYQIGDTRQDKKHNETITAEIQDKVFPTMCVALEEEVKKEIRDKDNSLFETLLYNARKFSRNTKEREYIDCRYKLKENREKSLYEKRQSYATSDSDVEDVLFYSDDGLN